MMLLLGKFDLLFPDPKYKRLIFSISFIPRLYYLGFTSQILSRNFGEKWKKNLAHMDRPLEWPHWWACHKDGESAKITKLILMNYDAFEGEIWPTLLDSKLHWGPCQYAVSIVRHIANRQEKKHIRQVFALCKSDCWFQLYLKHRVAIQATNAIS